MSLYVVIAANVDPMFKRLCDAMDQPELATDKRFIDHDARGNHVAELDNLVAEWTSKMTVKELDSHLEKYGVVTGPIYSIADIAKDPHYRDREMIKYINDETLGSLAVPGIAPKLTETEGEIAWLGPQELGSHNKEIYGNLLGMNDSELDELSNEGII